MKHRKNFRDDPRMPRVLPTAPCPSNRYTHPKASNKIDLGPTARFVKTGKHPNLYPNLKKDSGQEGKMTECGELQNWELDVPLGSAVQNQRSQG